MIESYAATESIACRKLSDMIAFNDGINQRNPDGTVRTVDGKPVSARVTLATWPDDALKILCEARDIYLSRLEGPQNLGERTDLNKIFRIPSTWSFYAQSIGSNRFEPGQFPAKTVLAAGEACTLAKLGGRRLFAHPVRRPRAA